MSCKKRHRNQRHLPRGLSIQKNKQWKKKKKKREEKRQRQRDRERRTERDRDRQRERRETDRQTDGESNLWVIELEPQGRRRRSQFINPPPPRPPLTTTTAIPPPCPIPHQLPDPYRLFTTIKIRKREEDNASVVGLVAGKVGA